MVFAVPIIKGQIEGAEKGLWPMAWTGPVPFRRGPGAARHDARATRLSSTTHGGATRGDARVARDDGKGLTPVGPPTDAE